MAGEKARAAKPKVKPAVHLTLSLIENAYSFLNQSLRHYRKASRPVSDWPFAMLHITQASELMLKKLLSDFHPILICENVDRPRHTVSLEQALTRLEALGVSVGQKEKLNICRAANYRNRVVHYEFELNKFEWTNIYAQLFEFLHFFHHKHLKSEIHASHRT